MLSIGKIVKNSSEHGKTELERVDYLDGWRGLAIALVLTSHFFPVEWINLGRMGVDVFFVLSGMLMSNILYVKRVPLNIFYKRRISRIFPVFIVFVSLVYAASFLFSLSGEHGNYLYTITFLRTYFPEDSHIWEAGIPIGHLWSLNVEEHCYILLGIITLFAFLKRMEFVPLIFLGVASIVLYYVFTKYPSLATSNYKLKTEVVAGHLLLSAGYFLIKDRFAPHVPDWLPLVTLGLAFFCYSIFSPWYLKWLLSPFLLAFTVNHLDLAPAFFKRALEFKPLRLLGIASFSIYLWQQPFYYYGTREGDAFFLAGPVLLAVSLLVGSMSFYYFENPVRKYINNRW